MIKGRKSLTELVPFGETIMFKIPKTSYAVGSFEQRWKTGVWIGTTIRDGMSLIGTPAGAFKVGTIRRKPDGEQWSQEMIKIFVGRPDPVVDTKRIITFAKKNIDETRTAGPPVTFQPPTVEATVPRNVRILISDVIRHGPTPGCAGCRAAAANKRWRSALHSRVSQAHGSPHDDK